MMQAPVIDRIIRSARRTLALEITRQAGLVVRAPRRLPQDMIEKVVLQRSSWIRKKQAIALRKISQAAPKRFEQGERFLYSGREYALTIVDEPFVRLRFAQGFFLSRHYQREAKKIFLQWYRQEAFARIKEQVDAYASRHGFVYKDICITNAQRCWGSCTHQGILRFSWRLLMAPDEVMEYVVVHELAHLKVKSHSARFWDTVALLAPEYKAHRNWLNDNGHRLVL
ncbi:MAG: SprT family zinc-dependent metalloprotease [Eubacteriales bacterium]|nr:SprT family zinc-dependent metalloprotease [Eubacteriales bacterium]